MEWLEIIKVRKGGDGDRAIDLANLKRLVDDLEAPTLVSARVYANTSITSDLVIILTWCREISSPWGSELARRFTQELTPCGLVDYSAWSGMD